MPVTSNFFINSARTLEDKIKLFASSIRNRTNSIRQLENQIKQVELENNPGSGPALQHAKSVLRAQNRVLAEEKKQLESWLAQTVRPIGEHFRQDIFHTQNIGNFSLENTYPTDFNPALR